MILRQAGRGPQESGDPTVAEETRSVSLAAELAAVFLAGDESEWITGQCLTVDGGHTIRKFPWLEGVARGVVGADVFGRIERGEAD